jgi:transposase-like protein
LRKDQTMKRHGRADHCDPEGVKTADLCRKHGISEASFYNWKAKYGGLGSQALAGPSPSYHGDGNSRMPATAGTNSARMIRIQRMTAVCGGGIVLTHQQSSVQGW